MVEGQDKCEWVIVSSGTSSPGYSRTKGPKTVVVVVVAIFGMAETRYLSFIAD